MQQEHLGGIGCCDCCHRWREPSDSFEAFKAGGTVAGSSHTSPSQAQRPFASSFHIISHFCRF